MENFLKDLCQRITELFFKGFGDYKDSFSGDAVLTGNDWQAIGTSNKPCKLRLLNMDAAEEMQWTPNKDVTTNIGARMPHGTGDYVDDFIGTAYAKMSDPTKTGTLNYSFIVLSTSE